jgi:hypothetical protein
MNHKCWYNYLDSLNALPKLGMDTTTLGGALVGALKGEFDAAVDNLKFLKGIAERGTWGDGKDGQILFGSGNKTYYFKDKTFDEVSTTLKPTITSLSVDSEISDKEKRKLGNVMYSLREALKKL